jgi:hypothetical protein
MADPDESEISPRRASNAPEQEEGIHEGRDDTSAAPENTGSVAGTPGPADEANTALGLEEPSVAGRPGPADAPNAALGVPPGATESEERSK